MARQISVGSGPDVHGMPKHIGQLEKELRMQMIKLVAEEIDVAEIYNPPRIAKKDSEMGSEGGWSLDLTTRDERSRKLDLAKASVRRRVVQLINKTKPLLIVEERNRNI